MRASLLLLCVLLQLAAGSTPRRALNLCNVLRFTIATSAVQASRHRPSSRSSFLQSQEGRKESLLPTGDHPDLLGRKAGLPRRVLSPAPVDSSVGFSVNAELDLDLLKKADAGHSNKLIQQQVGPRIPAVQQLRGRSSMLEAVGIRNVINRVLQDCTASLSTNSLLFKVVSKVSLNVQVPREFVS